MESDVYLLKTSYIFDVSVAEIFGWYPGGGRLAILPCGEEKDPQKILDTIENLGVTHINFVPSMFHTFLYILEPGNKQRLRSLKYIFLAGEAVTLGIVQRFNRLQTGIKLENIYGPTEATIYASQYSLAEWQGSGNIPIGKPLPNTCLYIIGPGGNLQPIGIPGELAITGTGLARGYLNNPTSTNKKFCRGSRGAVFQKSPPGRRRQPLYKTGDLAKWLLNGNIEFLGRIDFQVKIRGFRVELEEIETQLLKHPRIKQATVQVKTDKQDDQYLCAYIVPLEKLTAAEIRNFLFRHLPGYMIPSYFIWLNKIPMTASGKLDRKSLPEPGPLPDENRHTPPRNRVERQLSEICTEILGTTTGIHDNFFQVGGHSLKAAILVARIHKAFEVKLRLADIFKHPTISQLARHITGAGQDKYKAIEAVEKREFYPLSYHQKRLWIIQQMEPASPSYHITATVRLQHAVKKEHLQQTLSRLSARHDILRTSIREINNEPIQWVEKQVEIPLPVIDLSSARESSSPGEESWDEETEQKKKQFLEEIAVTPFDLAKAPLLRAGLIKLDRECYDFIFNLHHIITDGWSMELLKNEFHLLYESYRQGKEPGLTMLPIQYRDFAHWHNRQLETAGIKQKAHAFWVEKLKNLPEFTLPRDFEAIDSDMQSSAYTIVIFGEDRARLMQVVLENNTTLFLVLLSVFIMHLSRFSSQKDVLSGILGAGRDHLALHDIVGFFVNTLVVTQHVDYNQTFREFLQKVSNGVMETLQNQNYPLELVLDDLNMKFPNIPVLFNMVNTGKTVRQEELENAEPYHTREVPEVKFDMVLIVTEYRNGIEIKCNYRNRLFESTSIEYMMQQYLKYIKTACTDIDKKLEEYLFKRGRRIININKGNVK